MALLFLTGKLTTMRFRRFPSTGPDGRMSKTGLGKRNGLFVVQIINCQNLVYLVLKQTITEGNVCR